MSERTTRVLAKTEAKCAEPGCGWKGKRSYEARRHAAAEGHAVTERRTYAVARR